MRKIALAASALAAVALVVSCASAPPAEPQPEPVPQETAPAEQAAPEKPVVPDPEAELSQAKSLQERIDAYGLAAYDPDNYQAATRDLKAGEDAYGKDNTAAKQSLLAAIDEFNAVISNGGPLLVAKVQQRSESSKKAADDLKASVAVKDDYAGADAVYQRALQEKSAGDLEKAGKDFTQAGDLFDAVAAKAQKKKDSALQSIQEAEQGVAISEQKAADAEKSLKDEGFAAFGSGQ